MVPHSFMAFWWLQQRKMSELEPEKVKEKANESSRGQQSIEEHEGMEPVLDQSQLVSKDGGGETVGEGRNMVVRVKQDGSFQYQVEILPYVRNATCGARGTKSCI